MGQGSLDAAQQRRGLVGRFQACALRLSFFREAIRSVTGDAAHGLPPALGQGGGLVLMNAHALALALEGIRAVEEALLAWETAMRFIADNAQRWALRYDFLTRRWPQPLWFMRPAIIWAFRIPALSRRMRVADQGLKVLPRELFTGSDQCE